MHVRLGMLAHANPVLCPNRKAVAYAQYACEQEDVSLSARGELIAHIGKSLLAPMCEFCHYHKQAGTTCRKWHSCLHSRI